MGRLARFTLYNLTEEQEMTDNNEKHNPLAAFSLTGRGNELADRAQAQTALLDDLYLKGENSVWYAPPNTGKTLILLSLLLDAVFERRIEAKKVYYINADDTAMGMATKLQLLDDQGIHCLAPGHNGFKLSHLMPAVTAMAENGAAQGCLIVIDTLKKAADLMSKKECREFGIAAREFSMQGGGILGLAHTNKNRTKDDRLIHTGTTDLVEDFDSIYILNALEENSEVSERFIRFDCTKSRGPNAQKAYYSYSTQEGLSYSERLSTVAKATEGCTPLQEARDVEAEAIVQSIRMAITHGKPTKMNIIASVSKALRTSKRRVQEVLENKTGPDPLTDLWDYERRARGAHHYFLHPEFPQAEE